MAKKKTDYKTNTFNQELLQCAALCYFLKAKNKNATNGSFFDYLDNFANGTDPDNILGSLHADYDIKNNLGVFHNEKNSAREWVRSSIDIARFLIKKLRLTSNHEVHHQKSKFGSLIKDKCLKKISEELQTTEISSKPDTYNPTDIWIVHKNSELAIRKELNKYILSKNNTANIVANYAANKNTYKSIINRFYIAGKLYQISLKKSGTSKLVIDQTYLSSTNGSSGIGYKIIGSTMKLQQKIKDIDPYTRFILAFDEVLQEGNVGKIMKFIDDLVEVKKINYKDEVLQPNLIFELNYGDVNIPYAEVENWKLDTPGDTFNMQKIGGTAWSGGLNTNGIHQILENYPKYKSIFKEMQRIRVAAYTSILKSYRAKGIDPSIVTTLQKNEIIYKKDDLKIIKDALENTNLYITFLVESIQRLSRPYRGEKVLYGINEKEILSLTRKVGTGKFVTVNGDQNEIKRTVSNLKRGQIALPVKIPKCRKGDTTINYISSNKSDSKIEKGFYIFFISQNGKFEVGTKVDSVDKKQKTISLSLPVKTGGNNLKAFILDPYMTNVVSATDLRNIKGSESKTIKYLEEKYSKLQCFYMFMRGGKSLLNEVLKKQIILTIYGLVSKKGGKLFDPSLTKKVKEKYFSKNALNDFIIAPFMIVGD